MEEQKITIGAVCALFGLFGFSTYPVAMELSVECSYPVGEATSAGLVFISGYRSSYTIYYIKYIKVLTLAFLLNGCFIRQVQSIVYTVLLQALTTKLTDSSLSVCDAGDDANLSWMGEWCTIILH